MLHPWVNEDGYSCEMGVKPDFKPHSEYKEITNLT